MVGPGKPIDTGRYCVLCANVLGSCMEGVCGTCETEVVEGDVDHRDSVLNDDERASNEFMMICVSRCKSKRLVLDI